MKDKDQDLIFETYITELRASEMSSPLKDTDPETGKPVDCVRTEHDPKTGKKTQMKCLPKKGHVKQEGAFAGPGGNPDEEGSETYDDPDDPAFNPPSDAQLVMAAHQAGVEEMIVLDGEGDIVNRAEILKAIEDHDLEQDKRESTAGDWRAEDAEFDRETDQDRYGYPGDR